MRKNNKEYLILNEIMLLRSDFENKFDAIDSRLDKIENRLDSLETRVTKIEDLIQNHEHN